MCGSATGGPAKPWTKFRHLTAAVGKGQIVPGDPSSEHREDHGPLRATHAVTPLASHSPDRLCGRGRPSARLCRSSRRSGSRHRHRLRKHMGHGNRDRRQCGEGWHPVAELLGVQRRIERPAAFGRVRRRQRPQRAARAAARLVVRGQPPGGQLHRPVDGLLPSLLHEERRYVIVGRSHCDGGYVSSTQT